MSLPISVTPVARLSYAFRPNPVLPNVSPLCCPHIFYIAHCTHTRSTLWQQASSCLPPSEAGIASIYMEIRKTGISSLLPGLLETEGKPHFQKRIRTVGQLSTTEPAYGTWKVISQPHCPGDQLSCCLSHLLSLPLPEAGMCCSSSGQPLQAHLLSVCISNIL